MKLSLDTLNQEPKYQAALRIIDELSANGYMAFLVGGCVRDRYMGFKPSDYDIACNALPEQVSAVFNKKPFKVIPTGIEHGTLTVVFHAHAYEVTTLRKDVETDGRHAKVTFGSSLEEDAARRDFTMNAMFEDQAGEIKDFFNGREHIAKRRLNFVGEALERIEEDYLRIMRFFRFKARFKMTSDKKTLDAIKTHHKGLKGISTERITKELWGLLSCKEVQDNFRAIVDSKVFPLIFEGVDAKGVVFNNDDNLRELAELGSINVSNSELAYARLAFICLRAEQNIIAYKTWNEKKLNAILKGFRLSNTQVQKILGAVIAFENLSSLMHADIAQNLMFVDSLESYGGKGVANAFYFPFWEKFFELYCPGSEHQKSLTRLMQIEKSFGKRRAKNPPINGKEVMRAFSISSGTEVGEALSVLRRAYLNGDWEKHEEGLSYLQNYFKTKTESNS